MDPAPGRGPHFPLIETVRPKGQKGDPNIALGQFLKPGSAGEKDYEVLFSGKHNQSVMGVLSGGYDAGIGMALNTALNRFNWDRVALILDTILAVVILVGLLVA